MLKSLKRERHSITHSTPCALLLLLAPASFSSAAAAPVLARHVSSCAYSLSLIQFTILIFEYLNI
jgi:hypothetical protein